VSVTLATEQLETHAGMSVPVNDVNLDETSDDWLVEVRVLDAVRVHVAFKHLQIHRQTDRQTDSDNET